MSNDTTTTEITTDLTLTASELTRASRTADHIRATRLSSGVQVLDMSILEMLESSNPNVVRKGFELATSQLQLTESGRVYEARLQAAKAAEQAIAPTPVVEETVSATDEGSTPESEEAELTADQLFAQQIKELEDIFPTWEARHEFKEFCQAMAPEVPEVLIASIQEALALRESQIAKIWRTMLHHTGRFDRKWWDANLSVLGKRRLHKFLQLKQTDQLDNFFDEALTGLYEEMTELFPKLQEEVPAGSHATARKHQGAEYFGDPEERNNLLRKITEIISANLGKGLYSYIPKEKANAVELAKAIYSSDSDQEALEKVEAMSYKLLGFVLLTLKDAASLAAAESASLTPARRRPRNPGSAARKQKDAPKASKPKGPQKGGADLSPGEIREIMKNRPNVQGVPGEAPKRGQVVAGAGKGSKEKARTKK